MAEDTPFSTNPENAPQLSEETLVGLGYVPTPYSPSPLQETFHKENDPSLDVLKDGGYLAVVADKDGRTWLLKSTGYHREIHGDYDPDEVAGLARSARAEVFAANVAAYVGYPIPETRSVFYDGKPWIASAYIEDHIDISLDEASTYGVSNPSAVNCRHVFNALCRSDYDESFQGLIDPKTGTYFAYDAYFAGYEESPSVEDVKTRIVKDFFEDQKYFGGGGAPSLSETDKTFALAVLTRALEMSEEEAAVIFTHTEQNPEQFLEVIRLRARALIKLIQQGTFDTQEE